MAAAAASTTSPPRFATAAVRLNQAGSPRGSTPGRATTGCRSSAAVFVLRLECGHLAHEVAHGGPQTRGLIGDGLVGYYFASRLKAAHVVPSPPRKDRGGIDDSSKTAGLRQQLRLLRRPRSRRCRIYRCYRWCRIYCCRWWRWWWWWWSSSSSPPSLSSSSVAVAHHLRVGHRRKASSASTAGRSART